MRGKRIRGRVAGNKTEREAELERTKAAKEVEATLLEAEEEVKEKEEEEDNVRDRVDEESRVLLLLRDGWRKSASRRMVPRRMVRLGYQMVRTSSRCTVRSYRIVCAAPPASATEGPLVLPYPAFLHSSFHCRAHYYHRPGSTSLVSPNHLVLVVRPGDRKLTARELRISIELVPGETSR